MKNLFFCTALVLHVGLSAENPIEFGARRDEIEMLGGKGELERIGQLRPGFDLHEEVKFIGAFVIFKGGNPENTIAAQHLLKALLNESCVRAQLDPNICSQIVQSGVELTSPLVEAAEREVASHRFSGEDAFIFSRRPHFQGTEEQNSNNPDNGQQ